MLGRTGKELMKYDVDRYVRQLNIFCNLAIMSFNAATVHVQSITVRYVQIGLILFAKTIVHTEAKEFYTV